MATIRIGVIQGHNDIVPGLKIVQDGNVIHELSNSNEQNYFDCDSNKTLMVLHDNGTPQWPMVCYVDTRDLRERLIVQTHGEWGNRKCDTFQA